MKKLFFALIINVFLAIGVYSQDPLPRPSATPPSGEDVVKITTSLIQIDVSVTDSKGKIVSDLKPGDFEVYENGEKQKISHFSFVSTVRADPEAKKEAADKSVDKLAIPLPPIELRRDQIHRTIALIVDDLSLSFESTYQVRRSLKKYVDEQMQDGDLVAIIRTGAGIGALQQFTSDKRVLYAAIEKVRWNPIGNGKIGAFAPIEPTPLQQAQAAGANVSDEDLQNEQNLINSQNDFRSSIFATGTLGALRYVVGGMSELPGRKAVILFSEGFRLLERDEDGNSTGGRVLDFLKQLIDQANRSGVVFYTIDARGLQTLSLTAQDQVSSSSPTAAQDALSSRRDELFETQSGLTYLAKETGGFTVINNNDITGGVRRVIDDQSYYLLGYEPDADTFDPAKRKFNKLTVKVNRKDLTVRYRSGFFNVADRDVAKVPVNMTPAQQIQAALTSPFAVNGISLRLNALFGNDAAAGSSVRSLLHVEANDLKFIDQPDGSKKATFDVLAASFGDNGQPVEQLAKSYTINAKIDGYKELIERGFVYHFTFPVKKPGAYQFRVAIRDNQGGNIGSASQFIQVPNLKKNRLTLSSIVLESLTTDQWKQISSGNGTPSEGDPMNDTALRRVKTGSILRYGFEVYNAKTGPAGKPDVTTRVRVIRDGSLVLDGRPTPLETGGQKDLQRIQAAGAISFGRKMQPGEYFLQIIVTDNSAKEKQKLATQFVQFEVVE